MSEREPAPQGKVIPFPFALPDAFLAQLGYGGPYNLVGLYWEVAGPKLSLYDRLGIWAGVQDSRPYVKFLRQPQIQRWLVERLIDLGTETHHLLVAYEENRGVIASAPVARRLVREQRLEGGGSPPHD